MLYLVTKDFKVAIEDIFIELKETRELKEIKTTLSQHRDSNKDTEITKKNEMEILDLTSKIT